jgi:hypothetical protein
MTLSMSGPAPIRSEPAKKRTKHKQNDEHGMSVLLLSDSMSRRRRRLINAAPSWKTYRQKHRSGVDSQDIAA